MRASPYILRNSLSLLEELSRMLPSGRIERDRKGDTMTLPLLRGLRCVALVLLVWGCATPTWDQYRGNARRTAFAPWPSSHKPEILWKRGLGPMIDASTPLAGAANHIYPEPRNTVNAACGAV